MNLQEQLALALDPTLILKAQGMDPDPWQRDFLLCQSRYILLNCCRGAGKTRTTSALALHTALFQPKSLTLLISKAQRQAKELLRYVKQGYRAIGRPVDTVKENETELEYPNGSRIIALPGSEGTIRSFQGVNLLVIDEAARVPDDLYASVSPMTQTCKGRTILLSTPYGQRGFFWREWLDTAAPWTRFKVPWDQCPRIAAEDVAEERRKFGDAWVAQEYGCDFTAMEGLVYPNFQELSACICTTFPFSARDRKVGGIDFGWRNPFAAVWGILDKDDILWINAERYKRETPLHEHAAALPRGYFWAADPAGATEINELRAAGHKVARGRNDIRLGIQAVTARLRLGRLKVVAHACPNLIAESKLYRWPDDAERALHGENPLDEHNHALAALRYLVAKIDSRFIARLRRAGDGKSDSDEATPTPQAMEDTQRSLYLGHKPRPWLRLDNEELWR
jgi:hypothetical protein